MRQPGVVGLLSRAMRALITPARVEEGARTETWPCPVCERPVAIVGTPLAMRARGYWLPPSAAELTAVCALQHKAHRRDGGAHPLPVPPDPDLGWRAVEWGPGPTGSQPLVVLVPPAGVALVPDGSGSFDVVALARLEPSDLIGSWDHLIAAGEHRGKVGSDAVRLDAARSGIDWDHLRSAMRNASGREL